jgi:3-hydroxyacyl-[acyl-carrier-protein] dehydratase
MPGLKLTAVRGVKILGSAIPGDVVGIEASVTGRLGNLVQARGSVSVKGQFVLQAELTLSGEPQ